MEGRAHVVGHEHARSTQLVLDAEDELVDSGPPVGVRGSLESATEGGVMGTKLLRRDRRILELSPNAKVESTIRARKRPAVTSRARDRAIRAGKRDPRQLAPTGATWCRGGCDALSRGPFSA
jgi:hypothetical protein